MFFFKFLDGLFNLQLFYHALTVGRAQALALGGVQNHHRFYGFVQTDSRRRRFGCHLPGR